ncbi:MAG: T9SS type A sorting domain-containing protein [Aureispira sp.]|nr:T9SS type A sorting domain-containing protein [Aureispira sp.]
MKKRLINLLAFVVGFFCSNTLIAQDLIWAKQATGSGSVTVNATVIDAAGNIYSAGNFQDTADFDPGPGVFNLVSLGGNDNFILKQDAAGNFVWAIGIHGTGDAAILDLALDATGNPHITGYYAGVTDFDPSAGTSNLTWHNYGCFIAKYDALGNFAWAKDYRSGGGVQGNGLAVDATGGVYITGYFSETADFDPGPGTFSRTNLGSSTSDAFVSKLDINGDFVWAKTFRCNGYSNGSKIAVDASGVYSTGYFDSSTDFDPNGGLSNFTPNGRDIYINKLDQAGNLVWNKQAGGSSDDSGANITLDASGNVITVGTFQGTADFDPNAGTSNLVSNGANDIFVQKLDAAGNFVWAKGFGGTDNDAVGSVITDAMSNVYTIGNFQLTADLNPDAAVQNAVSEGMNDLFVQKLDAMGTFEWAFSIGGTDQDIGRGIAVSAAEEVYLGGYFQNTVDFDPMASSFNMTSGGGYDGFIAKTRVAKKYYVNENASGANSGLNWSDAFTSLKSATDIAILGDEIWVASGTYMPTGGGDRTMSFDIASAVKIYGGFAGSETMLSQRNLATNPTILSGDLGAQGDPSDNSYNVVRMHNADASTILDGLIIEHGNANGTPYPYNRGGGLSNNGMNSGNSSPTLQNCTFRWNMGIYGGAISNMSNFNGTVDATITGCLFFENTSTKGSAISNGTYQGGSNSSVITNCTFVDNVGTSIHNSNGGATITVQNSIIWDFGAPLYNYGNEATVLYCLVKSTVLPARTTDGGNNHFAINPQFVDAANENYALKPFSIGVDRGANGLLPGAYTTDLLGATRTVNTTVDLGAIEAAAGPAIIYVNHAAVGSNNGTSWTDAYTSLKAGLDAANSGSSIWVAGGTYMPTGNADRTMSFEVASGVKVYGGFAGGEGQLSQRDWATNPTVLSGDLGTQGDPSDNSYNVVRLQNTDTTTTLDGLIIEHGNANGSPFPYNRGGGLSNNGMNSGNSSPTLQNCIFRWNMGTYGGAISNISNYNGTINATITGCLFFENTSTSGSSINNSTYQGGSNSSVITNCTFADNVGTSIYNGNGGATIIVQNSIIWDFGAPLYNYANEATVQYCNLKSGALPARTIDGGNNMFATDPMFVDAANDDYKLQGASPAVAAGSNGLLPAGYSLDLAYTTRQNGATVELGCYEDAVSSAKTMANNNPTTVDENTSAAEEQAIETMIEEELEMSSLEEATTAINMTVYPNPVQDIVNIRLEGIQETVNLQLLNTAGQTIQQEVLEVQEGQTIQLDMSRLTNGIYLLNLQLNDGTRLNERVVKF